MDLWLKWMLFTIEHSGPTFTKLGQWASSRTDLFPGHICETLGHLQDRARRHSLSWTIDSIEHAFGRPMHEIFSSFDPCPVGTGAIAQVYRATLQPEFAPVSADEDDTSTATLDDYLQPTYYYDEPTCSSSNDVAVKVLHPHVKDIFELDLAIMRSVAATIEWIVTEAKWLSLPEEVDVFGQMMHSQLDLRVESRNLLQFRDNFDGWDQVAFPLPVEYLTAENILVETFIDGVSMKRFVETRTPFDTQLATLGLTSFLKMLLLDNHVHADLHPGNIIVTFAKNGRKLTNESVMQLTKVNPADFTVCVKELEKEGYKPFLYFIDAGLTSSLSPELMINFVDLFQAIAKFDGTLISDLMIERSKTPDSVIDRRGFQHAMSEFIDRVKQQTLAFKTYSVSSILMFVFDQVRKHHVKIQADFVNVGVGMMLVEGIGRQLDPHMDLLNASLPFLGMAIQKRIQGQVSSSEAYLVRILNSWWTSLF